MSLNCGEMIAGRLIDTYGDHKFMMVITSTVCAACLGYIISSTIIPNNPKITKKENV